MSRSLHFTDMEWEIADEAYADVLALCKRENRFMSIDEVAERIGVLNREARRAHKWKKRAKEAEATLRSLGIEPLAARHAEKDTAQLSERRDGTENHP